MSHCFFKKLVDSTNSQRLVSIHENKRMPAVYFTLKYNFVQTEYPILTPSFLKVIDEVTTAILSDR